MIQPVNQQTADDKMMPSIIERSLKEFRPLDPSPVKTRARVDFSIDAILSTPSHRTSPSPVVVEVSVSPENYHSGDSSPSPKSCSNVQLQETQFSWIYCTRYRPPKLPSKLSSSNIFGCELFEIISISVQGVKKETSNMRARYRNPRIPFSTTEVSALEQKFIQSPYLGSTDVNELAAELNMSPKRVRNEVNV